MEQQVHQAPANRQESTSPSSQTWLSRVRGLEFVRIEKFFQTRQRVLELGGGEGYQASLIASRGCEVISLEIESRPQPIAQFFPVTTYDGISIPYLNESFDVVFSSNVLEHVSDLQPLLYETDRVLRPDGIAIHVLPSATWRLWTSAAHYAYLVKRFVLRMDHPIPGACDSSVSDAIRKRGVITLILRALLSPPHGTYPTSIHELVYYSRVRWKKVFQDAGFCIQSVFGGGLFYTGYGLAPSMNIAKRKWLSKVLGSSATVFILRKAGRSSESSASQSGENSIFAGERHSPK